MINQVSVWCNIDRSAPTQVILLSYISLYAVINLFTRRLPAKDKLNIIICKKKLKQHVKKWLQE